VLTNYNLKRLSFGTGQPLIKSSELNKLKLEVPTNELEQQELGVIFFTIDTLIAANEQVPKLVIKIVNNSLANSSFSN
ncbi:hypothetical protein C1S49_06415, partial [Lactiplantibacillus plantarum]